MNVIEAKANLIATIMKFERENPEMSLPKSFRVKAPSHVLEELSRLKGCEVKEFAITLREDPSNMGSGDLNSLFMTAAGHSVLRSGV